MEGRTCVFYSRDGYCADGDCCEFLHDVSAVSYSDNRTPKICRFVNKNGGCKYGNACRFSHNIPLSTPNDRVISYAAAVKSKDQAYDVNSAVTTKNTVCRFNKQGMCAYGSSCRYIHDTAPETSLFHTPELDLECGICMNKLNGSQIGMLSHCNCLFCLNCIRAWRKDGLEISGPSQVRFEIFPTVRCIDFLFYHL